jgi:hypothetical protein
MVEQQLYDYIYGKEHEEVITGNGITISVADDFSLEAAFTLLDMEDAHLSISLYCRKQQFVKVLGIRNVQDIHVLTPAQLMKTYYEGLAKIVCWVTFKYPQVMTLKKLRNIIVVENDWVVKHEIPEAAMLDTPDEFVAYTKQYYKVMEGHEN